jgi:hypothetical protein
VDERIVKFLELSVYSIKAEEIFDKNTTITPRNVRSIAIAAGMDSTEASKLESKLMMEELRNASN